MADMNKFKVGDMAWESGDGFGLVEECEELNHINCNGKRYTDAGVYEGDLYPSLLTVEEAGRLGHYPPKKKVMKTFYTGAFRDARGNPTLAYGLFESIHAAEAKFSNSLGFNLGIATITIEVEE